MNNGRQLVFCNDRSEGKGASFFLWACIKNQQHLNTATLNKLRRFWFAKRQAHSAGISFVCQWQALPGGGFLICIEVVLCYRLKGFWKHLCGWWGCFILFCTFISILFWFNYRLPRGQNAGASGPSLRGPWGSPRPFQFPSISRYSSFAPTTASDYVDEPSWYRPGLYSLRSLFHCYYKCWTLRKLLGRWLKIQSGERKNRFSVSANRRPQGDKRINEQRANADSV